MKFTYKKIIPLFVVLTSVFCQSQTKFHTGNWNRIKQKAKQENKLIFVDLYFEGCAPCSKMDKEVFPTSEVSSELRKNFISFKTDIFKEEIGKKLSMKYGVTGFPTFLFLTSEGKTLDITSGYHTVNELLNVLKTTQQNAKNKIYKKYSINLNIDYPEFYRAAYMDGKRRVTFETKDKYLKQQKKLSAEIPFVVMTGLGSNGVYADYILENAEQLATDYSRMQVRNALLKIIGNLAKTYGKNEDEATFKNILIKVKPIFTDKEWLKFENTFQSIYNKYKA